MSLRLFCTTRLPFGCSLSISCNEMHPWSCMTHRKAHACLVETCLDGEVCAQLTGKGAGAYSVGSRETELIAHDFVGQLVRPGPKQIDFGGPHASEWSRI